MLSGMMIHIYLYVFLYDFWFSMIGFSQKKLIFQSRSTIHGLSKIPYFYRVHGFL